MKTNVDLGWDPSFSKFWTVWTPMLYQDFFKMRNQVRSDKKMPRQWLQFCGGLFYTLRVKLWNLNILFFCNIFFSWIRRNFFPGKKSKFCQLQALENKLIFAKMYFFDNWTKIEGQSWFGTRIYPRALTLWCWPPNFRIQIIDTVEAI